MANVNYIGGEYKVVEVTYDLEDVLVSTYFFKVDIDLTVEIGDLLVAENKNGLAIVKVTGCIENCIKNAALVKRATAWIVDKIDMSRQKDRREATERRKYILTQLEEKKEQVETLNMYALLAEMDPDAKKLLEELKTIGI